MITTQRERILLVELFHAEYAHTYSTNGMRSLCVVTVIILIIAAVGPGLNKELLFELSFSAFLFS